MVVFSPGSKYKTHMQKLESKKKYKYARKKKRKLTGNETVHAHGFIDELMRVPCFTLIRRVQ